MKKLPFLIFFAMFIVIAYSCIKAAAMSDASHKATGKVLQIDPADLDNSLVYANATGQTNQ